METEFLTSIVAIGRPKLFAWVKRQVTKSLRKLGKQPWVTLTRFEADALSLVLVEHVASQLGAAAPGRLLNLDRDIAKNMVLHQAERAADKEAGGKRQQQIADKREGAKKLLRRRWQLMQQLSTGMADRLTFHLQALRRVSAFPWTSHEILVREPYGGSQLLAALFERWKSVAPAQQFFLAGGGEIFDLHAPALKTAGFTQLGVATTIALHGSHPSTEPVQPSRKQIPRAKKKVEGITDDYCEWNLGPRDSIAMDSAGLSVRPTKRGHYKRGMPQ